MVRVQIREGIRFLSFGWVDELRASIAPRGHAHRLGRAFRSWSLRKYPVAGQMQLPRRRSTFMVLGDTTAE